MIKTEYMDNTSAWEYVERYYGADSVADCAEGVLLDSFIIIGKSTVVAFIETYVNPWCSCLTRYIARTKADQIKLWDMFDKLKEE